MSETVWIRHHGDLVYVSCYQARGHVQALPYWTRKWDAALKVWLVDCAEVAGLTATLRRYGYKVISDTGVPNGKTEASADWCTMMYKDLGTKLGDQCYRQLVKVLHPDHGVDDRYLKVLNRARDEHRTK